MAFANYQLQKFKPYILACENRINLKTVLLKNICPFKGETSSRNIYYCLLLLLLVVCKGETE